MYQYLMGTGLMAIAWALLFVSRKDLRKAMIWSGLFYFAVLTAAFIIARLTTIDATRDITPGYWAPPTLFDLGRKTGGFAVEDALFMFFAGGIAAALYESVFRKKISANTSKKLKKGHALFIALVGAALFQLIFQLNAMYLIIVFNVIGASV